MEQCNEKNLPSACKHSESEKPRASVRCGEYSDLSGLPTVLVPERNDLTERPNVRNATLTDSDVSELSDFSDISLLDDLKMTFCYVSESDSSIFESRDCSEYSELCRPDVDWAKRTSSLHLAEGRPITKEPKRTRSVPKKSSTRRKHMPEMPPVFTQEHISLARERAIDCQKQERHRATVHVEGSSEVSVRCNLNEKLYRETEKPGDITCKEVDESIVNKSQSYES